MTDYARIADGIVAEIIAGTATPIGERFHPDLVAALHPVPAEQDVQPGWTWDGSAFAPPAPPDPDASVPASITATQFWLELPNWVAVTQEEALAGARTGAAPAAIEAVLATLPSEQAFEARVRLARMADVLREDPLTGAIAAGLGKSEAELDDFFRAASGR